MCGTVLLFARPKRRLLQQQSLGASIPYGEGSEKSPQLSDPVQKGLINSPPAQM